MDTFIKTTKRRIFRYHSRSIRDAKSHGSGRIAGRATGHSFFDTHEYVIVKKYSKLRLVPCHNEADGIGES